MARGGEIGVSFSSYVERNIDQLRQFLDASTWRFREIGRRFLVRFRFSMTSGLSSISKKRNICCGRRTSRINCAFS